MTKMSKKARIQELQEHRKHLAKLAVIRPAGLLDPKVAPTVKLILKKIREIEAE